MEEQGTALTGAGQEDPNAFDEKCFGPRKTLKEIGDQVKALRDHPVFKGETISPENSSEMKANIMLAYRHIEDARMRLGKAVQAYDGGTSCYPR